MQSSRVHFLEFLRMKPDCGGLSNREAFAFAGRIKSTNRSESSAVARDFADDKEEKDSGRIGRAIPSGDRRDVS